jgi:hypothetical protein
MKPEKQKAQPNGWAFCLMLWWGVSDSNTRPTD